MKNLRTPYGVKDYTPSECYAKTRLEDSISAVLRCSGFCHVATSALDYADNFRGLELNKMFKLTDTDGSLLVLRPDITRQVVRLAKSKLNRDTQKLYYIANSFEFLPDTLGASTRSREFAQIGAEILNVKGISGDTEALILALQALKSSGLDDFIIELGHTDFLNGLLQEIKLNNDDLSELKSYLNSKDALGVEMFLSNKKVSKEISQALADTATLYGTLDVFEKAKVVTKNPMALSALHNLQSLVKNLVVAGFEKHIRIDLGLIKSDYYSGIIFKGLAGSCGSAILDGGRYNLDGTDGVGFCIGVERLLQALNSLNLQAKKPPVDIAYINKSGFCGQEFDYITKVKSQGLSAVKLFVGDKSALIEYCKNNGIKKAIVFSGKKIEEVSV